MINERGRRTHAVPCFPCGYGRTLLAVELVRALVLTSRRAFALNEIGQYLAPIIVGSVLAREQTGLERIDGTMHFFQVHAFDFAGSAAHVISPSGCVPDYFASSRYNADLKRFCQMR